MHGRIAVRIVVGVAVLAVAGFASAYFLFFHDVAPPPLTLSAPPAAGSSQAETPETSLAGVWTVASGSEVGYRVREKLASLPAQSDAVGRTPAVTGEVRVDLAGAELVVADGRFEADLTKLTSDESRRDARIRTQGLESNRFPTATFALAEPIRVPAPPAEGATANVSAVGDLTVHGVTKRVTIPVDARLSGDRIEVVGSHRFPRSDFDIDPPNVGGFVTVDSDATLEFRLLLQRG